MWPWYLCEGSKQWKEAFNRSHTLPKGRSWASLCWIVWAFFALDSGFLPLLTLLFPRLASQFFPVLLLLPLCNLCHVTAIDCDCFHLLPVSADFINGVMFSFALLSNQLSQPASDLNGTGELLIPEETLFHKVMVLRELRAAKEEVPQWKSRIAKLFPNEMNSGVT